MSLKSVLYRSNNFSLSELRILIGLVILTFTEHVQTKKNSAVIRIASPLFLPEFRRSIFYFSQGDFDNSTCFEMEAASVKMDMMSFASIAEKLLEKDFFEFVLCCESRNGLTVKMKFEKAEGSLNHVFFESEDQTLSSIFTKAIKDYVNGQDITLTTDPGSYISSSRLIKEKVENALSKLQQ